MANLLPRRPFAWASLVAFGLVGCSADAQLLGQSARPKPLPKGIELAFNHAETSRYRSPINGQWRQGDDLEAFVLASIQSARREILVAVQELSLPKLAEALAAKHREGLTVKVVLENTYSSPWSEEHPADLAPHQRTRHEQLKALGWGDAVAILQRAGVPLIDDTADGSAGSGLMHHISAPIAAEAICPTHSTNTPPQIPSSVVDRHPESKGEGAGFSRQSSLWAHA
jgi:hypothetical protein